jgi:putative toxin-antitoxin system antitoxin component (TIGR02293 family)
MSEVIDPVANVLGVSKRQRRTGLGLVDTIMNGLPVKAVDRVASAVAPGDANFRFRIVPKATLERRKKSPRARLTIEEGDRVARVAKVWSAATDVWGSEEAARAFLFRPHMLLAGRKPIDVALGTDLGARLVEDILGRLKFGSAP